MTLARPFKDDRRTLPLSHATHLQAIGDVMSLALCSQVVSQAPDHLRPSGTQTIILWLLTACQYVFCLWTNIKFCLCS